MADKPSTAYEIRKFKDTPGLYYEGIGTMSLYTDVWTLAIQMDLTHLAELEKHIRFFLTRFREQCAEAIGTNNHCGEMLDNIDRLVEKIGEGVGVIHDLVGAEHPRKRRGLIDGLGSVLKSITGNLDAADGERIDAEIAAVQETQETLKEGMKKQLHIVESTIDMFNRSSHAAQRNFRKMHDMVRAVNEYFSNSTKLLNSRQQFDESLALMDSYVETFLGEIKEIINLFDAVTSGTVSSAIITPEKLTKYLTDALPHIPRGYSFSRPVTRSNAASILRLATTKAYRKGEKVVLLLEIPLIGQSEFGVNRVYPLPKQGTNKTYYYLETKEDLVVVDRENRNYLRITSDDLEKCKKDGNRYFCKPQYPTMAINEDAPCSVLLYTTGTVGQERQCPKRAIQLTHTLIMSVQRPGRWLYVAPQEETIVIACNEKLTKQEILQGTGTLTLNEKCVVSAEDFKVETVRRLTQEIKDSSYVPTYNITLTPDEEEAIPSISDELEGVTLEHVVSNPQELNNLGMRMKNLKEDLDAIQPGKTQYLHTIGQYSIGTIALVGLLGYILYQIVKKKCSGQPVQETLQIPRVRTA